jgi:ketosteroid isomerase-like protein
MTVSDELKARREAVIQAHLDAETSMDVDAVLATLREDAAYELPTINRTFRGHAEIRSFLEAVFAALPGVAHHAERIYHTDDAVLVETASDVPGMAEPVRTGLHLPVRRRPVAGGALVRGHELGGGLHRRDRHALTMITGPVIASPCARRLAVGLDQLRALFQTRIASPYMPFVHPVPDALRDSGSEWS